MTWKAAASLRALFAEASRRWPDRSKASDGLLGDQAHAARDSDHNVGARGLVHAADITHDPAHGVDCNTLFDILRRRIEGGEEKRVSYVIWNRRILNPSVSMKPRPYTGANPHDKHMHISVLSTPKAENDVGEWFPPAEEEDVALVDVLADAAVAKEQGGWALLEDGTVRRFRGARNFGEPKGHDYWAGRKAKHFLPHPSGGFTVVATSGEQYTYDKELEP